MRNLIALVLADVERARDVPVGHASRELHLATEALERAMRAWRAACLSTLSATTSSSSRSRARYDGSHPAGAEQPEDLVAIRDERRRGVVGHARARYTAERRHLGERVRVGASLRRLRHPVHASSGHPCMTARSSRPSGVALARAIRERRVTSRAVVQAHVTARAA